MPEQDLDQLAELIAAKLQERGCVNVCPLGISPANVWMVKLATWAGGAFAIALIGAFASGVGYMFWHGFKAAITDQ